MQIPVLATARLELVPLGPGCAALYEQFYTDAEASRAYGGPITPAAAWTRLASDLGAWYLQGFGVWALARRADRQLIGTCGFWQGKGWPRELTWWLLPAARGAGLAQEASVAAIRHAYQTWRWPEVETYMNDDNAPARALVVRLGGVQVDRRRFPDGQDRDVYRLPDPGHG